MRTPFKLKSSGPFKMMGSKEKESTAMSNKIKEITRAEYNKSLGRSEESSI